MKKVGVFFLMIFLLIGCTNKSISDNPKNETNSNEIKDNEENNNKVPENTPEDEETSENENINNNSQQNTNLDNKKPETKPETKPEKENTSESDKNTNNNQENNNTIEDTKEDETAPKFTYVKDAIIKQICPNGYSDKFDGKNCYKYVNATRKNECLGIVIDGICYDTNAKHEYYCNGNDMYWEVKDRGFVKERLCLRYVLDIIKANALGECPDGYTLNSENKCEGYVHSMENKYQALIKYTCADGYTPYENTCIKKSDFTDVCYCPINYSAASVDSENCLCYDTSKKEDYIQKLTCENDNLILMDDNKCYSVK